MKKILLLLIVCFLTSFSNVDRVHQDFSVIENYKNIKTRITTGFKYEEIRKIEFIGKYAQKLAKERNYKGEIFLDFSHFYVGDCDSDYFISFSNGLIKSKYDTERKPPLKSDGIVIRQVSRSFDIATTLQLIEYAISNLKTIKSTQKKIIYKKNYEESLITTIDTTRVNMILKQKNNSTINKILEEKIWRQFKSKEYFSRAKYYTQNNKFYLLYNENKKGKIFELDNVYDFQNIDKRASLIFDSPNSFYYLESMTNRGIPKRIVIKNINDNYKPFKVVGIGIDKVAIFFRDFAHKQRTVIYDVKTKKIIQDLDKEFQD